MPSELFYWLFNMSLTATLSGIAVLLLRLIRPIPRRIVTLLWVIPFLRFWIPVGIGGRYGLMALISRFTTRTVEIYDIGDILSLSMTNHAMVAENYFPIVYKVRILEKVFGIASLVWIAVAVLLLTVPFLLFLNTRRELKKCTPLGDGLFLSDRPGGAVVYGIFRPGIVLPNTVSESDLPYVLMHERAHIRHLDNLWRMIAFVTAAVHWFNPAVWIFLKCFLSDLELACDERVLSKCSDGQKKDYARSLLSVKEQSSALGSAFGGAKLKVRITNILSYRKLTALSAVGFCLLVLACAYVLLTNAP